MSRNTGTFLGLQIVSIFHFHTYFFLQFAKQYVSRFPHPTLQRRISSKTLRSSVGLNRNASPTLPHFTLLSPEIAPTIIMHEDEEQEQADGNLNDTQRVEPLAKADLNVMLY
jgi:hypothetical protein